MPQPYRNGELVVVIDCSDLESSARFWTDVLGYARGQASGAYLRLTPEDGQGVEILLQRVPDRKLGKNRLHLDMRTGDLEAEVRRVVVLGASQVTREPVVEDGWRWHILADPDGNEFCVLQPPARDRALAASTAAGRSAAPLVVAVVAAFAAGAVLAWLPLTSVQLPFRHTPSFPIWVLIEASLCGLCPLVWSRGAAVLAKFPAAGQGIASRQWAVYAICALALIGALTLGEAQFRGVATLAILPSPLPYSRVRFGLIYAAAALAAGPSIVGMHRVGDASLRDDAAAADLAAWRDILQSQLLGLAAVVVLGTLAVASFRNAILAIPASPPGAFPAAYVLFYGLVLSTILALAYVPPSRRLWHRARVLLDTLFPIPSRFDGDWQRQLEQRRDLAAVLRVGEPGGRSIQNALVIGAPLITIALTLLIPSG